MIMSSNPQFVYHEAKKHDITYKELIGNGIKLGSEIIYTFSKDYNTMIEKENIELVSNLAKKTSDNLGIADIGYYQPGISETSDLLVKDANIILFCFAPSERGYHTVVDYCDNKENESLMKKTLFVCTKFESHIVDKKSIAKSFKGLVDPSRLFTFSRLDKLESTQIKNITISTKGKIVANKVPTPLFIFNEAIKGMYELGTTRRELDALLDYIYNPPGFKFKHKVYTPLIKTSKGES